MLTSFTVFQAAYMASEIGYYRLGASRGENNMGWFPITFVALITCELISIMNPAASFIKTKRRPVLAASVQFFSWSSH